MGCAAWRTNARCPAEAPRILPTTAQHLTCNDRYCGQMSQYSRILRQDVLSVLGRAMARYCMITPPLTGKPDITGRAEIEQLINAFYTRVQADDVIGFIFSRIAKTDWAAHMPKT